MSPTHAILAQSVPGVRLAVLIGVAIVVLIFAGIAVVALRRRLLGSADAEGGSLDLETLQRQRREGVVSEEEFRVLRRAILGLPGEGQRVPDAEGEDTSGQ